MTYGPIHGVPVGAGFRNRTELYAARVHRDIQRGICGGTDRKQGAESVVLSGGYEALKSHDKTPGVGLTGLLKWATDVRRPGVDLPPPASTSGDPLFSYGGRKP